jgi:hypothetical protein
MDDLARAAGFGLLLVAASAVAGDGPAAALVVEHVNSAGTFSLRTPEDWVVESRPGVPEITEARGGSLIVRILRREGEVGLDAYHVQCMQERLADPMKAAPQVDYEYDFRQGWIGEREALDSAFVVHYDEPVEGHEDWRQRHVTVIGGGESLCVVGMAPRRVWKKSREERALLEAVMTGVRLE